MKIKLIKLVDNLIIFFLSFIIPKKKSKNIKVVKTVLIIRPGGLGDALLLLKSINNFKKSNPFIKIDILCEKRNREAFDLIHGIDEIFLYDNFKLFFSLLKKYKFYDLVIDTEQWHFLSSLFARYLGKYSAGFNTNKRYKNFDFYIEYFHKEYEQNMFDKLFIETSKQVNFNYYNDYPLELKCKDLSLSYDIVIFTGASVWQRRWAIENYISLINKIKEKFSVCLIGGKNELFLNKKIKEKTNIDDLTGKLNLKEVCGLLKKSKLLFATDSGILHLGVIVGIKTVSLFGPGIEEKWAPKGKNHFVINKHLPCSPCTKFGYMKKCNRNAECMKMIKMEEVYKNIIKLLNY